jgi:hypothetical protein
VLSAHGLREVVGDEDGLAGLSHGGHIVIVVGDVGEDVGSGCSNATVRGVRHKTLGIEVLYEYRSLERDRRFVWESEVWW